MVLLCLLLSGRFHCELKCTMTKIRVASFFLEHSHPGFPLSVVCPANQHENTTTVLGSSSSLHQLGLSYSGLAVPKPWAAFFQYWRSIASCCAFPRICHTAWPTLLAHAQNPYFPNNQLIMALKALCPVAAPQCILSFAFHLRTASSPESSEVPSPPCSACECSEDVSRQTSWAIQMAIPIPTQCQGQG